MPSPKSEQILGIESVPNVSGGVPTIAHTRIPVWLLVQARQLGASDTELLEDFPSLKFQDLVNAWAYYDTYRDEIDRQIAETRMRKAWRVSTPNPHQSTSNSRINHKISRR